MPIVIKRIVCTGVLLLAGIALIRAATHRFQQKEQAFRQTCREQQQKQGVTRDAAKVKYPTPEIRLVSSGCLLPGGTGEVTVTGKFAPGTLVQIENDNIDVVKEELTAAQYHATVKIAPDAGPQTAAVSAISQLSCIFTRSERGVAIGGRYEWNLDSANGWKIVARSAANKPCGEARDDVYDVQFFRKGETAPFQKLSATLNYSLYEDTYRFSIQPAAAAGQGEYMELMKKLMDPKLPNADRDKLMKQIEAAQEQMMAGMKQMTDPAYIKKMEDQRKQFGCERIEVKPPAAGLTGSMRCSEAVGTRIALTGTMKFLGK